MPNGENGIHFLKDVTSFKGSPIEIDPGFKFNVIRYKIRKLNTFDSYYRLKDDVLPETLSSLKIVLPEKKSSLTLDPLKQMVIITP